ncbi:MAG: methylenetetrahydrofolate reductase [NAD(P)H], partial [Candidatus Eisenbacteria bacterium]|nr:methylenetetrahydrofolate reductase [NAD(P)H] [Candidatus Eisenbacteria bacterium]
VIPGLKILNRRSQLTSLPRNFHVSLPDALVDEVQHHPRRVGEIGRRWAVQQCRELLDRGVRCVHCYIMNDAQSVIEMIKAL